MSAHVKVVGGGGSKKKGNERKEKERTRYLGLLDCRSHPDVQMLEMMGLQLI